MNWCMSPELLRRLAQASGAAYELNTPKSAAYMNAAGVAPIEILKDPDGTLRGYVGECASFRVISIRGTASIKDALLDLKIIRKPFMGTMVHEGFLLEHDYVMKRLTIPDKNLPIYVTGHSLGAAVASLLILTLRKLYPLLDLSIATFGSPDVGDPDFVKFFNYTIRNSIRVVHNMDIVPRLLHKRILGYAHVDKLMHLNDQGKIIWDVKSFLGKIWRRLEVVKADFDDEAVANHHIDTYIQPLLLRQLYLQGHSRR